MTIVVDFSLDVEAYVAQFSQLHFPCPSICPHCAATGRLQGHGSYLRWACDHQQRSFRLHIKRWFCPVCRHTVSLLPSFCLSFRHYVLASIQRVLSLRFTFGSSWSEVRQHLASAGLPAFSTLRDWVEAFTHSSEVYLPHLLQQLARWQLGPGKLELALAEIGAVCGRPQQLLAAVPHLAAWLEGQGWRLETGGKWLSTLRRWGLGAKLARLV